MFEYDGSIIEIALPTKVQMNERDKRNEKTNRQKRKVAYRARHRLLSIALDAARLQQRVRSVLGENYSNDWPWVSNKHCGCWYLQPSSSSHSCYFKSTDGHQNTWALSLKRLNLPLVELLHRNGGCYLVDSSVRKVLPDSFSRTIPIWACVLNKIVQRYRNDFGIQHDSSWDTKLYTPASMISPEEHLEISKLIDSRLNLLYESKAIVDPKRLCQILTKPLRPIWITDSIQHSDTIVSHFEKDYTDFFMIVCCNPSSYLQNKTQKSHSRWLDEGFYYTPGAADDEETWGRNLTPDVFWENKSILLDDSLTEESTDILIDSLVAQQSQHHCLDDDANRLSQSSTMNRIGTGNSMLWVGSRRSGRPPECWRNFDAILNVTENEYSNMHDSILEYPEQNKRYYLQLPVEEGKRDRKELERWMPVGLVFLIHHLQQGRRVLVHCAQGKDRSVGLVLGLVVIASPLTYPLELYLDQWNIESLLLKTQKNLNSSHDIRRDHLYLQSGLYTTLVESLLSKEEGQTLFLNWIHEQKGMPTNRSLVTKDSIRISLHLIQQDREVADPTRSTMQKINRFFMSASQYR